MLDDLDAALRELVSPLERDASGWTRRSAGRWNAGQHVEHVGRVLTIGADALERAADELLRDDLGKRPWRDPIQALFVRMVTQRFPRGGRAPKSSIPLPTPDPERAFALVAQGALRHRMLADRLTLEQRDRLWIWNPYAPRLRWHYTFPEEVRVQTTHARHHARSVAEAAGASTRRHAELGAGGRAAG